MVTLFPYITDRHSDALIASPYIARWREHFQTAVERKGRPHFEKEEGPGIHRLPQGLVSAPVRIVDLTPGEAFDARFVGGMFGVVQAEDTGALSPSFGWAVVRE